MHVSLARVCSSSLLLTSPSVCLLWFGYFVSISTGPVSLCTSLSKLPQASVELVGIQTRRSIGTL